MTMEPIQSAIRDNHCIGCGPDNPHGLRIQSFWCGDLETLCTFQPQPHMAAGPASVLNGGIIATLIDCHAVCTAIAYARRLEGRAEAGDADFATGSLEIRYRWPAAIDEPVFVHAKIVGVSERTTVLACTLSSGSRVCAEANVKAVRVAHGWADRGQRVPPPAQRLGGWNRSGEGPAPLAKTA